MKPLEELYADLEKYKNFDENEKNWELFADTAADIVDHQDPRSIGVLLQYFDDNSDYDWVFQGIRNGIEHYPHEIYILELIKNIPFLLKRAPGFFRSFLYGIFNSDLALSVFRKCMRKSPPEPILELLSLMAEDCKNDESPHHRDLIAQLRKELEAL